MSACAWKTLGKRNYFSYVLVIQSQIEKEMKET